MPISGLVITLATPDVTVEQVRQVLAGEPSLSCGELLGDQLPVILETEDDQKSREVHDWLLSLPGVLQVDVVFVGLEE
jgi:nitrate reductase NapAB chaperone NapD